MLEHLQPPGKKNGPDQETPTVVMFSNLLSKVVKGKTLLEHSCQSYYLSFTFNKGAQEFNEKCQHSAFLSW
jgi:hypothetical protein